MKKECKTCNGRGEVRGKIDWLVGVLTFGLTALADVSNYEMCKVCDGLGYLVE